MEKTEKLNRQKRERAAAEWFARSVETIRERAAKLPEFPIPDDIEGLLRSVTKVNTSKPGGPYFSILRKPRKGATDRESCFHSMLQWHGNSCGSLWGPMGWAMRLGRDQFDQIDTLALLVRGGQSAAADAWARALGRKS